MHYPFLYNFVSSSAIHCGIDHVECINTEIALLGRAMHCLHEDHEKIVGKLADGLNANAQISDFLKSFIVCLGEADRDSDADVI